MPRQKQELNQLTGRRLDELTFEEIRRVHRTIAARFKHDASIVAISVGRKIARGRRRSGDLALRFRVHEKLPLAKVRSAIPSFIEVRLKVAGTGRFEKLRFQTDVETLPDIVPTGATVTSAGMNPGGNISVEMTGSVGIVVRTRRDGATGMSPSAFHWSMVTAGHLFASDAIGSPVAMIPVSVGPPVPGFVHAKTTSPSAFDTSVIAIDYTRASNAGFLTLPPGVAASHRSESTIKADVSARTEGLSLRKPPLGQVKIRVKDFYVALDIPALGLLKNVIEVEAVNSTSEPFRVGTSGSAWTIGGQLAAIQVAGSDPGFLFGYGQAVFSVLGEWMPGTMGATPFVVCVF